MKARRNADSDEVTEYAVVSLHDVTIDIVLAEAARDGVAHFYGNLDGSSISRA